VLVRDPVVRIVAASADHVEAPDDFAVKPGSRHDPHAPVRVVRSLRENFLYARRRQGSLLDVEQEKRRLRIQKQILGAQIQ